MLDNMSKKPLLTVFISFLLLGATPSSYANDIPPLIFPAACTYGKDCWAVNYLDVDPNQKNATDFKCSTKTYEAHHGSDFALGSIAQMNKGVNVVAAANGTVLRVRDGENDQTKTHEDLDDIRKSAKECGNGIFIDHGNGFQTMYCHLKQGSINVHPNDKVTAGQVIAQIGQSGLAEFPHLHFGITYNGKILDPFTGLSNQEGCGKEGKPLWADGQNIVFEPVAIFNGGFMAHAPDFKEIEKGTQTSQTPLPISSEALVLWTGFYNVENRDNVSLKINKPNGTLYAEEKIFVTKTRTRQYYFFGKKTKISPLERGQYTGTVSLERNGTAIKTREFIVLIE